MNRRAFLGMLVSLPIVGRLFAEPANVQIIWHRGREVYVPEGGDLPATGWNGRILLGTAGVWTGHLYLGPRFVELAPPFPGRAEGVQWLQSDGSAGLVRRRDAALRGMVDNGV